MRSFFPRQLSFLKQHPNSVFFVLFARKLGRYLGHPRQVIHTQIFLRANFKKALRNTQTQEEEEKNSRKNK